MGNMILFPFLLFRVIFIPREYEKLLSGIFWNDSLRQSLIYVLRFLLKKFLKILMGGTKSMVN